MSNWSDIDDKLTTQSFFATGGHYEVFKKLRSEDPVHWTEGNSARPFWSITRHADCVRILNDAETFSSEHGSVLPTVAQYPTPEQREKMGYGYFPTNTDPPDHLRIRRPFNKHWTAGAIGRLREKTQACIDEILAEVLPKGECDFVEDIAAQLPARLVCEIMGIPVEDRAQMRIWCGTVLNPAARAAETGQALIEVQREMMTALYAYMSDLANKRRIEPGEDFTSIAARLEAGGEPLTELEFTWWCVAFVIAGLESTRNAMSVGLLTFLQNPDQMEKLRLDPSLSSTAVDEIVRWVNPAKYRFRIATRDCDIGDKTIRAGDWVMCWIASANRDEQIFTDPDEFNIARNPNPHIAYGTGEHSCIGRNLARLEMQLMFNSIFERMTNIQIAGPFEWLGSDNHTALKSLPITFERSPEKVM